MRLTTDPVAEETEKVKTKVEGTPLTNDTVYAFYFHGPAYQVVGEAWRKDQGSMTRMADPIPDNHVPSDAPLAIAPRLAELCFQTAGPVGGRAGRSDGPADPGGTPAGAP